MYIYINISSFAQQELPVDPYADLFDSLEFSPKVPSLPPATSGLVLDESESKDGPDDDQQSGASGLVLDESESEDGPDDEHLYIHVYPRSISISICIHLDLDLYISTYLYIYICRLHIYLHMCI